MPGKRENAPNLAGMIGSAPKSARPLFTALAQQKRPGEILRLLLRLCTESELIELGMRFKADALIQKGIPIDEILLHFPGRADIVARLLIRQRVYPAQMKNPSNSRRDRR